MNLKPRRLWLALWLISWATVSLSSCIVVPDGPFGIGSRQSRGNEATTPCQRRCCQDRPEILCEQCFFEAFETCEDH